MIGKMVAKDWDPDTEKLPLFYLFKFLMHWIFLKSSKMNYFMLWLCFLIKWSTIIWVAVFISWLLNIFLYNRPGKISFREKVKSGRSQLGETEQSCVACVVVVSEWIICLCKYSYIQMLHVGICPFQKNNFLRWYYLMNHICLFEKSLLRGEIGYATPWLPNLLTHFSTTPF